VAWDQEADSIQTKAPYVVGLGGTTRLGSSTDRVLDAALRALEARGCPTLKFDGQFLKELPLYDPEVVTRTPAQQRLLDAVRGAGGVVVASPGYHGGVSALVKNALDLLEDLRAAPRPYLEGCPVGCIVTAYGWQACGTTLSALRDIAHALRGWPTPLGVALNASGGLFDHAHDFRDARDHAQVDTLADQMVGFLRQASSQPERHVPFAVS
jgi:FMN reductase